MIVLALVLACPSRVEACIIARVEPSDPNIEVLWAFINAWVYENGSAIVRVEFRFKTMEDNVSRLQIYWPNRIAEYSAFYAPWEGDAMAGEVWVNSTGTPVVTLISSCSRIDLTFKAINASEVRFVRVAFTVPGFAERIATPAFLPGISTYEYVVQLNYQNKWVSDEFHYYVVDTDNRTVKFNGIAGLRVLLPPTTEQVNQIYPVTNLARYVQEGDVVRPKVLYMFPADSTDISLLVNYSLPSAIWARRTVAADAIMISICVSLVFFCLNRLYDKRRKKGSTRSAWYLSRRGVARTQQSDP